MPDDVLVDASKRLIEYGALGVVILLLLFALVWVTKQWVKERDARLSEVRDYAHGLEQIKTTVEGNVTALNGVKSAVETLIALHGSRKGGRA